MWFRFIYWWRTFGLDCFPSRRLKRPRLFPRIRNGVWREKRRRFRSNSYVHFYIFVAPARIIYTWPCLVIYIQYFSSALPGYSHAERLNNRDGRGIVVGILDTGVDPAAIGLSVTSDGRPKVVDVIDCSGSGDVVMGPSLAAGADGSLKGVTGRTLIVNKNWKNPSGQYRLGAKVCVFI